MVKTIQTRKRKSVNLSEKTFLHPWLFKEYRKPKNNLDKVTELLKKQSFNPQKIMTLLKLYFPKNKQINLNYQLIKIKKMLKICGICQTEIYNSKHRQCKICEDTFHLSCLGDKKNWVCEQCTSLSDSLEHSTVKDEQSNQEKSDSLCKICVNQVKSNDDYPKFCNQCENLVKFALLPNFIDLTITQQFSIENAFPQTKDTKIRQICIQSLKLALLCQGIKFSDDLQYKNVSREENAAKLEPFIQKMSQKDVEQFEMFKSLTRQGYYGPLRVVFSEKQGFIVQTMEALEANTWICEYSGEVHYFSNQVFNQSDSIMSLLETSQANSSLVIIPDTYGNLAKYISGINNKKKNSKLKQQNVISRRYEINGEVRVILMTTKQIQEGEILYYDYNEGGKMTYQTKYFI